MTDPGKILFLFISLVLGFSCRTTYAQSIDCTGSFGEIAVGTDFGRGTSLHGAALAPGKIGAYKFANGPDGQPDDGEYTIVKSNAAMWRTRIDSWHVVTNHTPNDPNGYMMMINADASPGIFYQETVAVCPNTTYEFSAYVINILKDVGSNPELTFTIHDSATDAVLQTHQTGIIPRTLIPEWKKQVMVFRTPAGVSQVTLRIRNDASGGTGNDLALDDIAFRACGPLISNAIDGISRSSADFCEGTTEVSLKSDISYVYTKPQYQWQVNKGAAWEDIAGQINPEARLSLSTVAPGTYLYRLAVAEEANFSSLFCRIFSPELTINILPKPTISIPANILMTCPLQPVQLAAGGGIRYSWAPADGLSATDIANPIATPVRTTKYTVTVSNGTCYDTRDITVKVVDLPVADAGEDQKMRTGQSIQLKGHVSGDDVSYRWSPPDFLDDPTSLTPMASPKHDITYTLTAISAMGCATSTDEVFIRMFEQLKIPNTFSPNGDGVNDLWNIESLDTYAGASLIVMNRNGEQVFKSKGPHYAWDGKYKSKEVPIGSYYYIIDLGNGLDKQSGWLLVVR